MANFSIIADVMVRGLDSLKRLAGASEEVANETDEASDALGRFGKASGKAGKAADRASVDLEDAAQKFRAMGSSGTLAGDTLERFSIITSGPVGAAIGGLIIGTAAATASAPSWKVRWWWTASPPCRGAPWCTDGSPRRARPDESPVPRNWVSSSPIS